MYFKPYSQYISLCIVFITKQTFPSCSYAQLPHSPPLFLYIQYQNCGQDGWITCNISPGEEEKAKVLSYFSTSPLLNIQPPFSIPGLSNWIQHHIYICIYAENIFWGICVQNRGIFHCISSAENFPDQLL